MNSEFQDSFDVIVVGGGHAGVEAALAAARIGFSTLLITINKDTIALMPCNPSIGGPGKGHIVREIDALGGEMAVAIDQCSIHVRMLNTSKGPAVQALRAQADKYLYSKRMTHVLESQNNLKIRQAMVKNLILSNDNNYQKEILRDTNGCENHNCTNVQHMCDHGDKPEDEINGGAANVTNEMAGKGCEKAGNGKADLPSIKGVEIETGEVFYAPAVILTTGTFLNGEIHIGEKNFQAGRLGEFAATGLSESLMRAGFDVRRLKTGTVARVDARSIDFSKCIEQKPSPEPLMFSYSSSKEFYLPQSSCWITYTNEHTHEIIEENLHRSPLFAGKIKGVGPRYCPSIEDKVKRFPDRKKHPVFVEPEGADTNEIYLQGLSTSLPVDVQIRLLRSIKGLESVNIIRPGYAVEYDFVNPLELYHSLMTRKVKGLFLAGQINGTSGYEEAAAQGLIAGINATAYLKNIPPLTINRTEGYTGVLIDDLVTKGTGEPYRIFTSRVEHRLSLRFDNADQRLSPKGRDYGLLNEEAFRQCRERQNSKEALKKHLTMFHVKHSDNDDKFSKHTGRNYYHALKDPEICIQDILERIDPVDCDMNDYSIRGAEIEIKYEGYIEKQKKQIREVEKMENRGIPENLVYDELTGISKEARLKLQDFRPGTIGQASRISGVSPADITVLIYHIKRHEQNIKK